MCYLFAAEFGKNIYNLLSILLLHMNKSHSPLHFTFSSSQSLNHTSLLRYDLLCAFFSPPHNPLPLIPSISPISPPLLPYFPDLPLSHPVHLLPSPQSSSLHIILTISSLFPPSPYSSFLPLLLPSSPLTPPRIWGSSEQCSIPSKKKNEWWHINRMALIITNTHTTRTTGRLNRSDWIIRKIC